MAMSNDSQANKLFCVLLENRITWKTMYMNYISDPGQKTSIKLPKFMVDLADDTYGWSEKKELLDVILNRKEMIASIMAYLIAMYGDNMPEIYMSPDGHGLVMDIYIHHEHAELLKKFANNRRCKVAFLKYVFTTVQKRISELAGDITSARTLLGPFHKRYLADLKEKGQRADIKKIYSSLFLKNVSPKLDWLEDAPIGVGDNLLTLGWKDKRLRRSIYFNVVADTAPESIRWPVLRIGSKEPKLGQDDVLDILDDLDQSGLIRLTIYAQNCLDDYHDKYGLTAHWAENNSDLIFTIPVHIDHAPIVRLHLTDDLYSVKLLFSTCIYDHNRHYALTLANPADLLEPNCMMEPIERDLEHQQQGRKATQEEIQSVLLAEKCHQGRKDPMMALLFDTIRPIRLWHTESDDDNIA